MGSGKTSVGKKLAKLLEVNFLDLDRHLEDMTNKSINELFTEMGEERFRMMETKALKDLNKRTEFVVAAGGGTPCYHGNMQYMNTNGTTVYLRLELDLLLQRLAESRTKRPLLKDLNPEELNIFIRKKLAERLPIYEQAQYTVDAVHITNTVECIHQLVK